MIRTIGLVLAALGLAVGLGSSTGSAAIAPPWCGTPETDAAAALPDGSDPSHPVGSFPHIPYYAIGCTLDSIAARSGGRMSVETAGTSALGREMFRVTINALDTNERRQAFHNWQEIRRVALTDPARAQALLAGADGAVKVPIFIQGGIHGNEYEGVDAAMQLIEKLATTPAGADAEVDEILDHAVVVFNPIQNPDGRVAGTRANGNGFDLNRDYLTQSQSETRASTAIMHEWLPPEVLDLHGYATPTLIEATTKPHNPSIEYDLWLKWNQPRIDANEAALNAVGLEVQRPINDWCSDADLPPASGVCPDGDAAGAGRGRGLGRLGPLLHRDVRPAHRARLLDGRDVPEREPVRRSRRRPHGAVRDELVDARVRRREPGGDAPRRARDLPARRHRRGEAGLLSGPLRRRQQLDDRVPAGLRHPRAARDSAAPPRRAASCSGCSTTRSWSRS